MFNMSLRGIFDGGGVRKQNGHWQSSGKQDNVIVYDGMALVSGNPNPTIFKVKFNPLVGITFNRTLHFEMTDVTTDVDDPSNVVSRTGYMGLATRIASGQTGTIEVRHNYEYSGHQYSARISYQNTSGETIVPYGWEARYSPDTNTPKLVVNYTTPIPSSMYDEVCVLVADVSYSMTPVQETPRFVCQTYTTNTSQSFDMQLSFTIPPIPESKTYCIERWSNEDVELIIKPAIYVPVSGGDLYTHSRTKFNVNLT